MLISPLRFRPIFVKFQKTSLWITLLATLVGCRSPLIEVETVSPQKVGKTVYLSGKVGHLAPFLDNGAYQLEDGTGKIWVVTTQTLPQKNQQINLKGKIAYQSLPLAEQELGEFYLVELERPVDLPQ
ncbi:MAG: hypothetical protein RLZZ04_688 [Cyanobacteriota bacterium]|jgi:hypothetical protein